MKAAAELIPTVSLLLKDECPEETRAVLSYVRVCAAVLPREGGLQEALPHVYICIFIYIYLYMYIFIYVYMYLCICISYVRVCAAVLPREGGLQGALPHVCVCIYVKDIYVMDEDEARSLLSYIYVHICVCIYRM
jgi:hypothetical protein